MLTKEQAIDILERFDFFQGQRAGRELWNDKPFDVQEQDIADFSRDVALLKEYINAAYSEVEKWKNALMGECMLCCCPLKNELRAEVAREIFAKIENIHNRIYNTYVFESNDYSDDDVAIECAVNYGTEIAINLAELKKKYTEGKK